MTRSNGSIARQNIISSLARQANGLAASAISIAVLIRVLGGSGYGLWLATIGAMSLGTMADIGIQYAITQVVAEAKTKVSRAELGQIVTTGFWTILAVSAVMAIMTPWLIFATRPFQATLLHLNVSPNTFYWLLSFGITLTVLQQAPMAIFSAELGAEKFRAVRLIQSSSAWIYTAGLLTCGLIVHTTIVGLLVWYITWHAIISVVGPVIIIRRGSWTIGSLRQFRIAHLKTLLHRASAFFGTTIANTARTGLDAILIGSILGTAYAAKYGPSLRIFTLASTVVPIFFESLWPTLIRVVQGADRRWANDAFRLGAALVLATGAAVCVLMVTVGKRVLIGWVGLAGYPGADAIEILCVWFMVNLWVQIVVYLQTSLGRAPLVMYWTLIEGAANVALSLVLMRHLGLIGNAIASALSGMLFAALPLTVSIGRSRVTGIEIPWRLLIATVCITILVAGVAVVGKAYLSPISSLTGTIEFGMIASGVTVGALGMVALTKADRAIVRVQMRTVFAGVGRGFRG